LRFKSPLLVADVVVDEMSSRREDRPSQLARMREPEEQIHIEMGS
jgi:hypothetical protein